ncbi:MAG: MerR family transcriptional regulator [Oscillospiraceae bacterium]|jgi:DNA-binding transcriptional MerR regulator|nr:MerR family transcriptional regulator [Oscillospiraceae bacterium]
MRINEVEALVGITKKNIRFYEEKGLLSPRRSTENGYRDYGEAEVETLRRIKLLRKLGVPIEEIRRMQEGTQTVGDGMRRHLVTLEREKRNLQEASRLCELLRDREVPLSELDAGSVLAEMEQLEQAGAAFRNTQRQDVRIRYVAPIVVSVVLVALMAATAGVMLWAFYVEPENAPPLGVVAVMEAVPLLVIAGVLLALFQRMKEISKGEIDDAKQY